MREHAGVRPRPFGGFARSGERAAHAFRPASASGGEMNQDASSPPCDVNADLCACLDGECDPDQRARMTSALGRDPSLALRLATWRGNDSALRAAFHHTRMNANAPDCAIPPIGPLEEKQPAPGLPGIVMSATAAYLAGVVSAGAALVVFRITGLL